MQLCQRPRWALRRVLGADWHMAHAAAPMALAPTRRMMLYAPWRRRACAVCCSSVWPERYAGDAGGNDGGGGEQEKEEAAMEVVEMEAASVVVVMEAVVQALVEVAAMVVTLGKQRSLS